VGSISIVIESDYSGILHCDEGGDAEQVARTSTTILYLCNWLMFNLSLTLLFYFIVKIYLLFYYSHKFIGLNSICIKKVIAHLNSYLRRIIRRSSEPFTRYTASLLGCEFEFVYMFISLFRLFMAKFLFSA